MIMDLYIKEFSKTPGVRTPEEGDASGFKYRTEILEPKFKEAEENDEKLNVHLDGTLAFATSFLEEVFGGLVRAFGLRKVKNRLNIISTQRPFYIDDINEYMEDAEKNSGED
ncbi:DUF4325 domain-containing protein [Elizabethkingia anophelis]|nr:DUF4325 domain-containing protein [Elizabethkingia anophelis]